MPNAPTSQLAAILRKYWGYEGFRPLQAEAMQCVLSGRDSVVVLPTGGGKSLCFQAPAMCQDGLAVVVSPLIALMKDQVDALSECGIPAAYINSTLTENERRTVADRVRAGELRLLYLAPERLVNPPTIRFLQESKLGFIAIDEAHCISAWGHDFRPEFRRLRVLREAFPGVGIHAYTATATETVRTDIAVQLDLKEPEFLVGSFDRPNLVYQVVPRDDQLRQVRGILDRHQNQSGIIYCIRRKDVDDLAAVLRASGYRALPYHAGMSDDLRKRHQEAFISEECDVIIATVAFGMGIDKSNVRFVIHAAMPKSLECYQQESGRAGRDGLEADCVLLYSGGDYHTWQKIIRSSEPDRKEGEPEPDAETVAERQRARGAALQSLSAMYQFCTGAICRHREIVRHFGQDLDDENCGACDVCLGGLNTVDDALVVAQKILSCVVRLKQRFGADYTTKVLAGSKEKRILENQHEALSTWGLLSEESQSNIRSWIDQLVANRFLEKEGEYSTLSVTDLGWQVLRGEVTPTLLKPATATKKSAAETDSWEGVDADLFEELRQLRRELATEQHVPPYVVFSDAALRDMARRRPSTIEGFLQIHGVGQVKCDSYGRQFVAHITLYCEKTGVEMDVSPPSNEKPRPAGPRNAVQVRAFEMFREGASCERVAEELNRAASTVAGYLQAYLEQETITDPTPWVDAQTTAEVEAAANEVGEERLKLVFDALEGRVSYDVIRVVLTCARNRERESKILSQRGTATTKTPSRSA